MIEIIESAIFKIITLFSTGKGYKFNRMRIKELTGISNIVLDNTLNRMVNLKLLNFGNKLYSLNFENSSELVKEAFDNYNKFNHIRLKEYFMVINIFDEISKVKNVENAYLFGSYSKLLFTPSSDIDVAIVSDHVEKDDLNKVMKKLEKRYHKSIEIHYFSNDFYKNKRDPLVKEILTHGIKVI